MGIRADTPKRTRFITRHKRALGRFAAHFSSTAMGLSIAMRGKADEWEITGKHMKDIPDLKAEELPLIPPETPTVARRCPQCKGRFNLPLEYLDKLILCPLCKKPVRFGSRASIIKDILIVPSGCLAMLLSIAVWLFMVGIFAMAGIMFVKFVLSKLGIMEGDQ